MNKRGVATVFFLSLMLFLLFEGVAAQSMPVSVGVSPGDEFRYDLTFYWYSTNPADLVPAYLIEQNQTDYFQLTVQTTTSTTVVFNTSWRLLNGTIYNSTEIAEVSSGVTGCVYVYAANLSAGGLLFPSSTTLPWRINSTEFRVYAGSFREINHISVNSTNIEGVVYSHMDLYFDKLTGIVVEYTLTEVRSSAPNQKIVQHLILKDSNVWVIPEFPSILALPIVMAVTGATFLILKRKKLK
ncbi:MAG: hypothetical protein N3D85_04405 [Candidatus Bathyarchaeota archaeon]|nr:hypothetical protein [Candidatus Bathyarchaeota archaeon]